MGFFWSSEMLRRGVYMHPCHNMFLSVAMTEADIDSALQASEGSFAALKAKRTTLQAVEKLKAFLPARAVTS